MALAFVFLIFHVSTFVMSLIVLLSVPMSLSKTLSHCCLTVSSTSSSISQGFGL